MHLLCIIGLGIAATGALSHHLTHPVLEAFAHLQPWVLTATLAFALIAVLRQHAVLSIALTLMGAYHLSFTHAQLGFDSLSPSPRQVEAQPNLRALQFNINADNPHYDAVAEAIGAAEADIIVICEANVHVLGRLEHLHEQYPHRIEAARWPRQSILGVSGTVLWSRFPFIDSQIHELAKGNIQICRATIDFHGTAIGIYAAHLLAPRNATQIDQRDLGMQELGQLIAQDPVPNTLLIGDLNHSIWTPPTRHLLRVTGMRSVLNGRMFLSTWPSATYPFGIAIDHMLFRGTLHDRAVNSLPGHGSDHRMLVAEFSIDPAPSPSTP